jgi:hypothetical protein
VDKFGNPTPGPGSTVFSDADGRKFVTRLVPIACDPSDAPNQDGFCEPERYEVGLAESSFNGELFADGWSPQNALENHSANQQFFAFACAATLAIGAQLDPSACAFNLFGTPSRLIDFGKGAGSASELPPFGEVMSCILAGEIGFGCQNYMSIIARNVSRTISPALRESAIVPLNRDPQDGFITATSELINRDTELTSAPPLARQILATTTFTPGDEDMLTLDSTLTNEQRALLGCGPFFGTRCDASNKMEPIVPSLGIGVCELLGIGCTVGGGLGFLSMEGNVLIQSFAGIEGTPEGVWLTTSGLPQPGTIDFAGGPTCNRYDPELQDTVVLPGCRGINRVLNRERAAQGLDAYIGFQFDDGYDPRIDGCVLGATMRNGNNVLPVQGFYADGTDVDLSPCNGSTHKTGGYYILDGTRAQLVDYTEGAMSRSGAGTLWHPFAGCDFDPSAEKPDCVTTPKSDVDDAIANPAMRPKLTVGPDPADPDPCNPTLPLVPKGTRLPDPLCDNQGNVVREADVARDFEADFFESDIDDQSQIFRSELAAFSWNFMQFLVQASCDGAEDDIQGDPKCFDPAQQFAVDKCSYAAPQLCENVKSFFGAVGVERNIIRARGNEDYGQRSFIWHSGGELVLKYQKRNVLGFSMDFGEDTTKSNWGVEFTWVNKQNFFNNNDFEDNVSQSSVLNLTVSADRPTFINFLNQNRTFFLNTQWFFQYITNYESGYVTTGPLNVLFTVAIFTGYFQDRLNPLLVTVYDFRSGSGGVMPSVTYRFTEALSVGVGMNFFFGRTQLVDMPARAFAPSGNRAGKLAYKDGVDHAVSNFRDKDEIWLKLRWTF